MMIPVYCAACGIQIGVQEYIVYGPDGYEHIDYGEVRQNEEYGGEIDGEYYCNECAATAATADKEVV